MVTAAVHRIVEQHAASRGDLPAVIDGERGICYRELNYAANLTARQLMTSGFRRGTHAVVRMPRGIDLAITLLAVLKAGGAYSWSDPGRSAESCPEGVSFACGAHGHEARYQAVDLTAVLGAPATYSPNLPVIVRGCDTACVLERNGDAPTLVPHATIAALRSRAVPHPTPWNGDASGFDLWMALMAGTTAVVETQAAAVAAA